MNEQLLFRACALCSRIDLGGRWVDEAEAVRQLQSHPLRGFTHTICPRCADYVRSGH